MFAGPLFSREVLTAPRQLKHYLVRAGYVAVLLVLLFTASLAIFGAQQSRTVGDVARFGKFIFAVFAVVQLSIVIAAAALFGSGNVAQEKDRRTLILLLMTDLHDRELVVGKLLAGLLTVFVLIAVSFPVFCFVRMFGGVTFEQVLWTEALCAATALAAGSWGSLVAFWREKTFQTLAVSVLGVVLFIGVVEAVGAALAPSTPYNVAVLLNPYRALAGVLDPLTAQPGVALPTISALGPVAALLALSLGLTAVTIGMLRRWYPSQAVYEQALKQENTVERQRHRDVWANPVVWREICTRAYGRRIALIKLAYFVLAGFALVYLWRSPAGSGLVLGMISREGFVFVGLSLVALLLVNAQAVTAITSERDGQTLELLLATDVTPQEFIFGKLWGIFYNGKEVLAVPLLAVIAFRRWGGLSLENSLYLLFGLATLVWFAAMLGIHAGVSYDSSRTSIANSLGTVFFLFIGIFVCMMLIVEARSSFALQFTPFLVFVLGGSLGLWASLTHKNPSPALTLAAITLPFFTFYAITSFLLENTLGVCWVVVGVYGFTTVAMLIPAISEFDVALGRTTLDRT